MLLTQTFLPNWMMLISILTSPIMFSISRTTIFGPHCGRWYSSECGYGDVLQPCRSRPMALSLKLVVNTSERNSGWTEMERSQCRPRLLSKRLIMMAGQSVREMYICCLILANMNAYLTTEAYIDTMRTSLPQKYLRSMQQEYRPTTCNLARDNRLYERSDGGGDCRQVCGDEEGYPYHKDNNPRMEAAPPMERWLVWLDQVEILKGIESNWNGGVCHCKLYTGGTSILILQPSDSKSLLKCTLSIIWYQRKRSLNQ